MYIQLVSSSISRGCLCVPLPKRKICRHNAKGCILTVKTLEFDFDGCAIILCYQLFEGSITIWKTLGLTSQSCWCWITFSPCLVAFRTMCCQLLMKLNQLNK